MTAASRFIGYTSPQPNGCWLWTGGKFPKGYGMFWFERRSWKAHRWAAQHLAGMQIDGRLVLHCCDTPSCVNPQHLFVGTQSDNLRDAARKGRCARQKLDLDAVRQIRSSPLSQRKIAKIYGVSPSRICRIRSDDSHWAEIC